MKEERGFLCLWLLLCLFTGTNALLCYWCSGVGDDRDCELHPYDVSTGPVYINCRSSFCITAKVTDAKTGEVKSFARLCDNMPRGNQCVRDSKLVTCYETCTDDFCNSGNPGPNYLQTVNHGSAEDNDNKVLRGEEDDSENPRGVDLVTEYRYNNLEASLGFKEHVEEGKGKNALKVGDGNMKSPFQPLPEDIQRILQEHREKAATNSNANGNDATNGKIDGDFSGDKYGRGSNRMVQGQGKKAVTEKNKAQPGLNDQKFSDSQVSRTESNNNNEHDSRTTGDNSEQLFRKHKENNYINDEEAKHSAEEEVKESNLRAEESSDGQIMAHHPSHYGFSDKNADKIYGAEEEQDSTTSASNKNKNREMKKMNVPQGGDITAATSKHNPMLKQRDPSQSRTTKLRPAMMQKHRSPKHKPMLNNQDPSQSSRGMGEKHSPKHNRMMNNQDPSQSSRGMGENGSQKQRLTFEAKIAERHGVKTVFDMSELQRNPDLQRNVNHQRKSDLIRNPTDTGTPISVRRQPDSRSPFAHLKPKSQQPPHQVRHTLRPMVPGSMLSPKLLPGTPSVPDRPRVSSYMYPVNTPQRPVGATPHLVPDGLTSRSSAYLYPDQPSYPDRARLQPRPFLDNAVGRMMRQGQPLAQSDSSPGLHNNPPNQDNPRLITSFTGEQSTEDLREGETFPVPADMQRNAVLRENTLSQNKLSEEGYSMKEAYDRRTMRDNRVVHRGKDHSEGELSEQEFLLIDEGDRNPPEEYDAAFVESGYSRDSFDNLVAAFRQHPENRYPELEEKKESTTTGKHPENRYPELEGKKESTTAGKHPENRYPELEGKKESTTAGKSAEEFRSVKDNATTSSSGQRSTDAVHNVGLEISTDSNINTEANLGEPQPILKWSSKMPTISKPPSLDIMGSSTRSFSDMKSIVITDAPLAAQSASKREDLAAENQATIQSKDSVRKSPNIPRKAKVIKTTFKDNLSADRHPKPAPTSSPSTTTPNDVTTKTTQSSTMNTVTKSSHLTSPPTTSTVTKATTNHPSSQFVHALKTTTENDVKNYTKSDDVDDVMSAETTKQDSFSWSSAAAGAPKTNFGSKITSGSLKTTTSVDGVGPLAHQNENRLSTKSRDTATKSYSSQEFTTKNSLSSPQILTTPHTDISESTPSTLAKENVSPNKFPSTDSFSSPQIPTTPNTDISKSLSPTLAVETTPSSSPSSSSLKSTTKETEVGLTVKSALDESERVNSKADSREISQPHSKAKALKDSSKEDHTQNSELPRPLPNGLSSVGQKLHPSDHTHANDRSPQAKKEDRKAITPLEAKVKTDSVVNSTSKSSPTAQPTRSYSLEGPVQTSTLSNNNGTSDQSTSTSTTTSNITTTTSNITPSTSNITTTTSDITTTPSNITTTHASVPSSQQASHPNMVYPRTTQFANVPSLSQVQSTTSGSGSTGRMTPRTNRFHAPRLQLLKPSSTASSVMASRHQLIDNFGHVHDEEGDQDFRKSGGQKASSSWSLCVAWCVTFVWLHFLDL